MLRRQPVTVRDLDKKITIIGRYNQKNNFDRKERTAKSNDHLAPGNFLWLSPKNPLIDLDKNKKSLSYQLLSTKF